MKTIITLALILPSIAMASWWNPISWFKSNISSSSSVINDLEQQIIDLKAQIKNIKPEIKTETKTITQIKEVPKIVYQDKYLPCPVAPTIATQSLVPAIQSIIPTIEYSDFNFAYTIVNGILSVPQTARLLIIKKAIFTTTQLPSVPQFSIRSGSYADGYKTIFYNLEKIDNYTYEYVGPDIELKGSSQIQATFSAQFDMANWIIWDQTVNKQVKI